MAIVAAVFVFACLWVGWNDVIVRVTGQRATGTVIAVEYNGIKHAWWKFAVTRPDGSHTTVVARQYIRFSVPDVGSKATVIYDPADPENRVVFGSIPSPMEMLTVTFTLGAIPMGWFMFRRRRRSVPWPPVKTGAESLVGRASSTPNARRRAQARREDRRRAARRQAARQRSAQRRAFRRRS